MADRPKHPKPEGEKALKAIEALGWDVTKPGQYFQCRCNCPGKHQTYVHLTPSNPRHFQEKVRYCRRECENYEDQTRS